MTNPRGNLVRFICHLSSVIGHLSFRVWGGPGSLGTPRSERDFAVAVPLGSLCLRVFALKGAQDRIRMCFFQGGSFSSPRSGPALVRKILPEPLCSARLRG